MGQSGSRKRQTKRQRQIGKAPPHLPLCTRYTVTTIDFIGDSESEPVTEPVTFSVTCNKAESRLLIQIDSPIQSEHREFPPQSGQIEFKGGIVHGQKVEALAVMRPDDIVGLLPDGQAEGFRVNVKHPAQ